MPTNSGDVGDRDMSFFLMFKGKTRDIDFGRNLRVLKSDGCQEYLRYAAYRFFKNGLETHIISSPDSDDCQELIEATQWSLMQGDRIEATPLGCLVSQLRCPDFELCLWFATDIGDEFKHIWWCLNTNAFLRRFMHTVQHDGNFVTLRIGMPTD